MRLTEQELLDMEQLIKRCWFHGKWVYVDKADGTYLIRTAPHFEKIAEVYDEDNAILIVNAANYIQRLISELRQTQTEVLRLRNLIENSVKAVDRNDRKVEGGN